MGLYKAEPVSLRGCECVRQAKAVSGVEKLLDSKLEKIARKSAPTHITTVRKALLVNIVLYRLLVKGSHRTGKQPLSCLPVDTFL